jgi:hypothetical protein
MSIKEEGSLCSNGTLFYPLNAHEPLHREVGALEDAGADEQALDVVSLVEVHCQVNYLLHGEGSALHVVGAAADAIGTVEDAVVGEQDFQEGDASPILRVGVADTHARGVAKALVGILTLAATAGATNVIFGSVCQNLKFLFGAVVHFLNHFLFCKSSFKNNKKQKRNSSIGS